MFEVDKVSGIPGIFVSPSKQISCSKQLKVAARAELTKIPHCIAVKLKEKFYLACTPIKKLQNLCAPSENVLIFKRSHYCVVSCANVQNKEPHLKAGTVPEHIHV